MPFKTMTCDRSYAMLTDLYEITMACGYWKEGRDSQEAVFHLTFRENPFNGGFVITAGLECLLEYLEDFKFSGTDLEYLGSITGNDGKPLLEKAFLEYLSRLSFTFDIDAMPEGTVAFPHEPLVRVQGPIIPCQLIETILLNTINFQTLIATKSARVCIAAGDDPVIEFGLRRAHGIDGGIAASRAAYIGGCTATSHVLAGKLFGIPVRGTLAHSWVMSFDSEQESFDAYADALPNNCIFLVDTYDTISGVRRAAAAGRRLRERGYEMTGIRLDSGDIAYLSGVARRILDEEGFPDAKIVASNELDEHIIESLKEQGEKIDIWGVGTKLVTAFDQPALGGVYKLSAVRFPGEPWRHTLKLSEQLIKVSDPGILQVRRYSENGQAAADVIYDRGTDLSKGCTLVDPFDMTRQKHIPAGMPGTDLLEPVIRAGKRVSPKRSLHELRDRARQNLARFHPGIKRFVNPHRFPVGLEKSLFDRKTGLILKLREECRLSED